MRTTSNRSKAEMPKVLREYVPEPTASRFHKSNDFVRYLQGPFGCVAPDTLVVTDQGPRRIADLTHAVRVLSWNEKTGRFQFSLSGGAYPKGKDYLYRVSTPRGEFDAAEYHRIYADDGAYQLVGGLSQGQSVFQCSPDLISSVSEDRDPRSSILDAPHYSQRVEDSLVRYAESARRYGQQLLREVGNDQASAPSQDDAHTSSSDSGLVSSSRRGGLLGRLLSRIHPSRLYDHSRIDGFYPQASRRMASSGGCGGRKSFSPRIATYLRFQRFLLWIVPHRRSSLLSLRYQSYISSLSVEPILSVQRQKVKEEYWDMQVLDTNNYVTVDGTIHHNSGKSVACVMELFSRSLEQAPDANGVRRTRFVLVRNTFPELLNTTIKTFQDWIPDAICPLKKSPVLSAHMKMPLADGTRVDSEYIFLSLDSEADVGKLKSLEATGIWLNEASELEHEILKVATSRVGRYPAKDMAEMTWTGIIIDSNAPNTSHWLYDIFEVRKPRGYSAYYQPPALLLKEGTGITVDGEAIPPEFVPNTGQRAGIPPAENVIHHSLGFRYWMQMAEGKDLSWVKVFIQGEYGVVTKGKVVYPEYRDSIHHSKKPLEIYPGLPILLGFDYGRTPACVIAQMSPVGQVRVLREFWVEDMGLQSFLPEVVKPALMKEFRGMSIMVTGDPAGSYKGEQSELTCENIIRDAGFNYMPAISNKPSTRIEAVVSHMIATVDGKPGFVLDPSCQMLREGFTSGYHYRKIKTASGIRYSDTPEKNEFSHLHDALQYICLYFRGFQVQTRNNYLKEGTDIIKKREVLASNSGGWT